MKIAFDQQIFYHQPFGGISRYFVKLSGELARIGQNARVFAPFFQNQYLKELPTDLVKGQPLPFSPKKTRFFFRIFNHLLCNRWMNSWNPDIIHETYFSALPSTKRNCPTVASVYDMIQEIFAPEFQNPQSIIREKKKTIERVDHFISISHNTKNDFMRLYGVPSEKISVVHLGVELQSFNESDALVEGDTLKVPYILHVGVRKGYKNFAGLLKAVSLSKSLRNDFRIIAFGAGKFSDEEKALIENLNFKPKQVIQIDGSDQQLRIYYRKAAIFVYPSIYEGFGLPPLEAMAAKCPVACSNTSSLPEVTGNAAATFSPNVPEEIMRAIENVVYSPNRASQLKILGEQQARKFSWRKCANETLEVYRKIARK